MSAGERFAQVLALNQACDALAAAGVRRRLPDADETTVRRAVAELRLGPATVRAAYGDVSDPSD